MSTSNFNLKNIKPEVIASLKKESAERKISINSLILDLIDRGLGRLRGTKKTRYHDLDHLAGTWTDEDVEEFKKNIALLEELE